jgi:hypothetical protein
MSAPRPEDTRDESAVRRSLGMSEGHETLPDSSNESPGVPGFRTWRGIYWFVFACFVVFVVALALFSRAFA